MIHVPVELKPYRHCTGIEHMLLGPTLAPRLLLGTSFAQPTQSVPRSRVQRLFPRVDSLPALFIVLVADPAHGTPSAGHIQWPPGTSHQIFGSMPPSCSSSVLTTPAFTLPTHLGRSTLGPLSPLAVAKGWLAVGSVYPELIADPGCWWSEERAVFTQCLCFNGSPCTFKGTNTD